MALAAFLVAGQNLARIRTTALVPALAAPLTPGLGEHHKKELKPELVALDAEYLLREVHHVCYLPLAAAF